MKGLEKFLSSNSSPWNKLKSTGQIIWDAVSRAYTWEYGSQQKYLKTMGGAKEDKDLVVEIY